MRTQMEKWSTNSALALLLLASALWMVTANAWNYLLDDAFIHIRYAKNLSTFGYLTFNGTGQLEYGVSAPMWVLLLWGLSLFLTWEWMPLASKFLSVFFSLAIVMAVYRALERTAARIASSSAGTPSGFRWVLTSSQLFGLVLTLPFAAPNSIRWLQDGMETSLAVYLSAISAAQAVKQLSQAPSKQTLATAFLVIAPGLVRIDLVPISAAGLMILALRRHWRVSEVGLAMLLVYWGGLYAWTGQLMPDTVYAKQSGTVDPLWPLAAAKAVTSAGPIWFLGPVGLVCLLLLGRKAPQAAVGNSTNILAAIGIAPMLVIWLAGSVKGQYIHGARYFLPQLVFSLVIFLWLVAANPSRTRQWIFVVSGIVLAAASLVFSSIVLRNTIAATNEARIFIRSTDKGKTAAGHDFGRLAWYGDLVIVDLAGLVNGTEIARARGKERLCLGASRYSEPAFLFLTEEQSLELSRHAQQPGEHSVGSLEIACDSQIYCYRNSQQLVMQTSTLTSLLRWYRWDRCGAGERAG